jgi:predicted membrane-bound mannosyltransferase/DNA-binding beta-propeller fold protein YncE
MPVECPFGKSMEKDALLMQTTLENEPLQSRTAWLERPVLAGLSIKVETIIFAVILLLAVGTRLYGLDWRVMSHDENTHVYYSWKLYQGQGFQHDPLMHGPFLFHITAFSYFLLGDNDFTARLPQALFAIAAIAFLWNYRRYFGKAGILIAATMMLISPYMLFYARYARNEAYIMLFGVATLWAALRYLETGKAAYTYWLTAAMVLHFTSKETSFIYIAQLLLFLGLYLAYQQFRADWPNPQHRRSFFGALLAAIILMGGAGAFYLTARGAPVTAPATPATDGALPAAASAHLPLPALILGGLGVAVLGVALYFLIRGQTWEGLKKNRAFSLLMLMGTLVLPQLSAFIIFGLGWTVPTNAGEVAAMTNVDIFRMGLILFPLILASIVIGIFWDRKLWLVNAAIWYSIFIVFYTSVFTNGAGFFTGMVGSLGYWLKQQGVNRGSQPLYYYWLIQVPVYEYLPALGSLLALGLTLVGVRIRPQIPEEFNVDAADKAEDDRQENLIVPLLGFWSITSLIAFTVAGEKMPWLTVHIALPMILLAGITLGYLVDSTHWGVFRERRGWLVLVLIPIFMAALFTSLAAFLGPTPPFQGKDLLQLAATSTFLFSLTAAVVCGAGLYMLARGWPRSQLARVLTLYVFAFLGLLTARTALTASFVNYDNANELLVYAHAAGGDKLALAQIEEISRRTTDGLSIAVAYDNETSYPFWWYLRHYKDQRSYGSNPTRSLRDAPVILVGDANYGKIEPVVGNAYNQFDYIRLWWPNQDYYDLTSQRVFDALIDPKMRSALFQIWLNRDYTEFGQAVNPPRDMSFPNWQPSARMRLYIRKDLTAKLWNYGVAAAPVAAQADPYDGKQIKLMADKVVGQPGTNPGQLSRPRRIAIAADGSLFVADTDNHRIQHLAVDGTVIKVWGKLGDVTTGQAPGGTFNQPWSVALGQDGSVYVADTWNHRVQKFTQNGEFVKMWGYFGQAEKPDAFWGPRDIAVDGGGRIYITDTGNKRIVVFTPDGEFVTQFGAAGLGVGEFDEPVGLAIGPDGVVYVVDTWNQRIQTFSADESGNFKPLKQWPVNAWFGQSLDNKPYLAIGKNGHVFVSDPEAYRVLEFTNDGQIVRWWGDFGTGLDGFGMAGAPAVDADGSVWVTDAGNASSRILHFTLP